MADITVSNEPFYYNLESHTRAVAVGSSGRTFWLPTVQFCPNHYRHTPVIPALGKLRQEDCLAFGAILDYIYIANFRPPGL